MTYRILMRWCSWALIASFCLPALAQDSAGQVSEEEFKAAIEQIKRELPVNIDESTIWVDVVTDRFTITNSYEVHASTAELNAAANAIETSVLEKICSDQSYFELHELDGFEVVFEYTPNDSRYAELSFSYDAHTCN